MTPLDHWRDLGLSRERWEPGRTRSVGNLDLSQWTGALEPWVAVLNMGKCSALVLVACIFVQ